MARKNSHKEIRWELVEADWAAGLKTVRQMAQDYRTQTGEALTHEGLRAHFKKLGIPRDLQGRIRQRAQALVDKQLASGQIRLPEATEKQIVEVAARNQADIILQHRKDIPRYKALAASLLSELEMQTSSPELYQNLAELLQSSDPKDVDRLQEAYRRVCALPGRVDSFKKLTEALKTLIGLERQAFGLSDNANGQADMPKEETAMGDKEAARRIAFTLLKASRSA